MSLNVKNYHQASGELALEPPPVVIQHSPFEYPSREGRPGVRLPAGPAAHAHRWPSEGSVFAGNRRLVRGMTGGQIVY